MKGPAFQMNKHNPSGTWLALQAGIRVAGTSPSLPVYLFVLSQCHGCAYTQPSLEAAISNLRLLFQSPFGLKGGFVHS